VTVGVAASSAVELCARLASGNGSAADEFIALLLTPLVRRLREQMPYLDNAVANDAVEDALLGYLSAPLGFDPCRSRIDTYLLLAARRNAIDVMRKETKRKSAEAQVAAQKSQTAPAAASALRVGWSAIVPVVTRNWTEEERRFLEARCAGEHQTQVLARLLGEGDSSFEAQRQVVKRMTDRIRKRLKQLEPGAKDPAVALQRIRR
jgi:DNA-directed RNA polymerase specialized sigma24 family protein